MTLLDPTRKPDPPGLAAAIAMQKERTRPPEKSDRLPLSTFPGRKHVPLPGQLSFDDDEKEER